MFDFLLFASQSVVLNRAANQHWQKHKNRAILNVPEVRIK